MAKEKTKRKKHPQYDTARQLYVEVNMDLKEIAAILEVSATTLTKWNQEGNWNRERELFQTMPQKLSERLQQMALRILELSAKDLDKLTPQEVESVATEIGFMSKMSDAISKISKSIVAINDRIDESAAIQVMIRFDRHLVAEGALRLAQELKPFQHSFYKTLSNGV